MFMRKIYCLSVLLSLCFFAKSQTPVSMSSQAALTYTANFTDIANWTFNGTTGTFSSGIGSAPWKGNAVVTGSGIPNPNVMTTSTLAFSTGSSGGVQKATQAIQFLTTGTTANTTSFGFDLFLDFTDVNAGTLSFNAATVFNSTGDRVATLRVYASTDGLNWTQLTGGNLPYIATNNVAGNAPISSIPLPSSFNGSPTARLRFYYHNGDANGTTGSRPKISIDDLTITATNGQNASPSIVASPNSLVGFSSTSGAPSGSQSFTASGSNLTNNILVSTPEGYELSTNNSIFSPSVTLIQNAGTVSNTAIYVRLKSSSSPGAANGSISLTSGTASNSVSVSGTVIGLINLATSPYVQNFNAVGTGLPTGITVRTGATASTLGTETSFANAPATWNNTGGGFKNFASGYNDQGVTQSTATDRAAGVRQVSGTDPGAGFVFQVANTSGKINFTLDFNLQSLDASSARITTWRVDYGFGVTPSSFVVPTTTGNLTTGGNTFSNNPIHVDFGNALDNQTGVITIRVVAVTASSGSGNRASTGLDDFTLTWEDPTAKTFSVDATAINFPVTNIGNSTTSTYKIITQTNLEQPLNIVASSPYTLSTDNISFVSNLSIPAAEAFNKTIYVKFQPTTTGVYPGTITHTSEGATAKLINLSGEAVDPNALTFNFNTCSVSSIPGSAFLSTNITGAQKWKCSQFGRNGTNGVDVNGFATGAAQSNDAWLISPALNLNNIVNLPVLSFYSRGEFTGNKIQLFVSTTYDGSSVPNIADWTELEGNFPTPSGAATTTWTFSDNIDLSSYKLAPKLYIAFRYTSSAATNAARWSVDDIAITDQSTLLTVNPSQFNFGEVSVGASSSSQSVTLKAIGSNDLTITAPAGYELSTDNVSFSTSGIQIDQASAAAGTSFYVRFSPVSKALKVAGNINISADGLNKDIVAVTGSSFPKSETFDVACYNLSFFGAGSTNSATPEQIAMQVGNISTVMQKLNADVIGIEEMSNDGALDQLVATLPGYSSVVSDRWSYSFNPPDPTFPPQKTGLIYNTATMTLSTDEPPQVMFESLYDSARLNLPGHRLTDYPTGTPSSFWASGRLPFMATFNATVDGATKKIRVIVIHAKSGGDNDGYIRRQYDAKLLKDSLDAYYSNDKVIIVGDYNDRMITSIYAGHISSYQPFVDDVVNYDVLTKPLDAAGKTSFPGDAGMIDHITVANDFVNEYIPGSTDIEDARAYIANYNSVTASDHLPVMSRFQFCKVNRPGDITVSNETGQCGASVNFNVGSTMGCGVVTASPASGSFFPIGTTIVHVTSSTGDTASFKVTVADNEKPSITAPPDVTANAGSGLCETARENISLGNASYSDNCSGTTVTNDAPAVFPVGATTVTWTVTDASGNSATAQQLVTIRDNELPAFVQPADTTVGAETGKCSATVSLPVPATTDNCGIASVTNDAPANGVYPVGTHIITWTVTDIHGNSVLTTQTVTVNDNENPTVTSCPSVPVLCYNPAGTYTIPAITATDNCGSVTYKYVISGATTRSGNSSNASGPFNIGVSTITWTVTDSHNNTSSCQTTVRINSPVISTIPDMYAVTPGGAVNTIYIGYGPSSVALNANVSGGSGTYSYKWTIGSSAGHALNSTSSYTISPTSTSTYYFNVKDTYGCVATLVTKTISVMDVRCGTKLDKVAVCSTVKGKPTTSCIFQKDVASALSSQATLGACVSSAVTTRQDLGNGANAPLTINGMPNPSSNYFKLSIDGGEISKKVSLRVTDVLGRVVDQKISLQTHSIIEIGSNYRPGTYVAEVMQGSVRKQIKLVKL
jgi:trimeric autotransporter adhesin